MTSGPTVPECGPGEVSGVPPPRLWVCPEVGRTPKPVEGAAGWWSVVAGATLADMGMQDPTMSDDDRGADHFLDRRLAMVRTQLADRGIHDPEVLRAMAEVPREAFVPDELRPRAYEDRPLPIGFDQTISQPYVVAVMVEALSLEPHHVVLEIGAGSGYAAAVMSRIASQVHAIERIGELARRARERARALGYENLEIRHGDGLGGWPQRGPFDAILISAAGARVPEPVRQQLVIGGRLLVPVATTPFEQQLKLLIRSDQSSFEEHPLGPVRFVPLLEGTVRS